MKKDLNLNHSLDDLLRRCIACGICLPHCATWAATGNEVHSPRGRLLLLEDLLQDQNPETMAEYAQAFDFCIGCRACETVCPSGVPFSLLQHGQRLVSPHTARPSPALSFLNRQLDSSGFLSSLRVLSGVAKSLLRGAMGPRWRRRLNHAPLGAGSMVRLLGSMPSTPDKNVDLIGQMDRLMGFQSVYKRPETPAPEIIREVAFFTGCANEGFMPGSTRRLVELLEKSGCNVNFPDDQQCCGALASHTGRPGKAARLQHTNEQSFQTMTPADMPVLVEAAGCGLQLKEYGPDVAERIADAVVFLDNLHLPQLRELPLKVVYHDPCHALHGQGIFHEPRALLKKIPKLTLVEPLEGDMCCGSGGAWGLHHQEISEELGRRKASNLISSGADLVVTSNPGCLGQIADGLALQSRHLPILPLTDLLWYAAFTMPHKKGRF